MRTKNFIKQFNGCAVSVIGKPRLLVSCIVMVLVGAFLSACSEDTAILDGDVPQVEMSRAHFDNKADLEAYLSSYGDTTIVSVAKKENPSIMEAFRANTAIGAILNDNLEFEVGNTIYKYGQAGYTIYEIEKSAYDDAGKYYNHEAETLAGLSSYPSPETGRYELEDGVTLYYTGDPVFEYISAFSPVPTRISADGLTRVQVSYWKSRGIVESSCGVEVEAWSRNSGNEDFASYETDLQVQWDIYFNAPGSVKTPAGGSASGHGNVLRKQIYWCTGYYSMDLVSPSLIVGQCKCHDGSWLSAKVSK